MKKIVFMTPDDAIFGFRLTGVDHHVVERGKAEESLFKIIGEKDTGLVIIDERLLSDIAEEKIRDIERSWHGIMLILPSPERTPAELEDYAARLIRRAVGYHVRLNL